MQTAGINLVTTKTKASYTGVISEELACKDHPAH